MACGELLSLEVGISKLICLLDFDCLSHLILGGQFLLPRHALDVSTEVSDSDKWLLLNKDLLWLSAPLSGDFSGKNLRLLSTNLLEIDLLRLLKGFVPHLLRHVGRAEVGRLDVAKRACIEFNDLTANLLVRAEITLAGVGAQINESSLLSCNLSGWLVQGLSSCANLVSTEGCLLWEHRCDELFDVNSKSHNCNKS